MPTYEVRVQITTDDQRFFRLNEFKLALAHYALGTYGVENIWVNDQKYLPDLDQLEGDD